MSTWTDETHVRARRAVEDGDIDGENGWAVAYLADALDEIERLRAENERLCALTTITDDMVKRAGEALYENFEAQSPHWNYTNGDFQGATLDGGYDFETALRAALEAALNTKEEA